MKLHHILFLSACVAVSACELESRTAPRELPNLQSAKYYVQQTAGRTLPAVVAARENEYDVLDSVSLSVDSTGYWTSQAWLRRYSGETLLDAFTVESAGSWAAEPAGYIFATNQSIEAFIIRGAFWDDFTTTMRIEGLDEPLPVLLRKEFAQP